MELEDFDSYLGSSGYQEWFKARVDNIHRHITAADVLERNGHGLRKSGMQREQISCPFHGEDRKPSARYFPESDESRSAVWCYVCHERWDAIKLWQKFSGTEKFSHVLLEIEQAYGISAPDGENLPRRQGPRNQAAQDVERLVELCEYQLRVEKSRYDMTTHLKFGSLLDQLRFAADNRALEPEAVKDRLQQLVQKMREKKRR